MTVLVRCLNGIQTLEKTWPFFLVKKASGRSSFNAPQSGCSQGAPLSQNTCRRPECTITDCFSDAGKSKRQIETAFTRIEMTSILVSLLTFIQHTEGLSCRNWNSAKITQEQVLYLITTGYLSLFLKIISLQGLPSLAHCAVEICCQKYINK